MKTNVALVAGATIAILLLLIWLFGFWKVVGIAIFAALASAAVAFMLSRTDAS